MSAVPAEIAGIGSTQQKLRVSPGFDPLKAAVGPQEYFVLSRIDGLQTLREVLLTTGLPVERAITIVQRLRAIGALLVPGETTAPGTAASSASTASPAPRIAPAPGAPAASSRTVPGAIDSGPHVEREKLAMFYGAVHFAVEIGEVIFEVAGIVILNIFPVQPNDYPSDIGVGPGGSETLIRPALLRTKLMTVCLCELRCLAVVCNFAVALFSA